MAPDPTEGADETGVGSAVRDAFSLRSLTLLLTGIFAGAGISVLASGEAVALPVLGSTPGQMVGVAGLAVAGLAYKRYGCGSDGRCGCSDDCGDRCSHDP